MKYDVILADVFGHEYVVKEGLSYEEAHAYIEKVLEGGAFYRLSDVSIYSNLSAELLYIEEA